MRVHVSSSEVRKLINAERLGDFVAFVVLKYTKDPTNAAIIEWAIALDFGLFIATFILDFTAIKPKLTFRLTSPDGRPI